MGLLDYRTQNQYYTGNDFGTYQFVSLSNIINAFMYTHVGESKLISIVSRTDVQFHAMRAAQELSYDVLRSIKSQEIEVPPSLKMMLPQDYVNYVKLARVGTDGIERRLYPTGKTSNPFHINQKENGDYEFGQAKRVVDITAPAGTDDGTGIVDGDYLKLAYKNNDGDLDYFYFRFHNSDWNTYDNPTGEGVVIGIDFNVLDVSSIIATKLQEAILNTGYYSCTKDSSKITITYNDDLPSTPTDEGFYLADGTGGGGSTGNWTWLVTESGVSAGSNLIEIASSTTWDNYQAQVPVDAYQNDDSTDVDIDARGRRYGLDPQHAHINGTFFIDNRTGFIHFGSSLSGETIVLKYVSDGLGTDAEMVVHKFAEEAVYKWIAYGILSTRSNMPEYVVQRYRKERFAATRKAKIRLSNIKMEEFTQVLKGMSKPIK